MGLFGGGKKGGGLGGLAKAATGGGGLSAIGVGGGGFGGGGGGGGYLSQLPGVGGDLSEWWKKSDPYDLSGQQTRARKEAAEKQIAENRARMEAMFAEQPQYDTEAISYKGKLNKRLGKIKDVRAGKRFGEAGRATDMLSERAFGTDESPWLKQQLQLQELGESQQRDQLAQRGALQQQQQMSNLAMQGGLSGGARERMADANMQQQMMQQQQLARQGQMDRLGLRSAEEQRRFQLQQQMPGMQLGLDQYQTGLGQANRQAAFNKASMWQQQANADEARRLQNAQARHAAEQQAWQQKMAAEGGLAESSAMLRSGQDVGIQRYKVGGMGLGGFGSGGLI